MVSVYEAKLKLTNQTSNTLAISSVLLTTEKFTVEGFLSMLVSAPFFEKQSTFSFAKANQFFKLTFVLRSSCSLFLRSTVSFLCFSSSSVLALMATSISSKASFLSTADGYLIECCSLLHVCLSVEFLLKFGDVVVDEVLLLLHVLPELGFLLSSLQTVNLDLAAQILDLQSLSVHLGLPLGSLPLLLLVSDPQQILYLQLSPATSALSGVKHSMKTAM